MQPHILDDDGPRTALQDAADAAIAELARLRAMDVRSPLVIVATVPLARVVATGCDPVRTYALPRAMALEAWPELAEIRAALVALPMDAVAVVLLAEGRAPSLWSPSPVALQVNAKGGAA